MAVIIVVAFNSWVPSDWDSLSLALTLEKKGYINHDLREEEIFKGFCMGQIFKMIFNNTISNRLS